MELNTVSQSVFTQLANVIFEKAMQDVPQTARMSGLYMVQNVPENTGNIRQYTEIDLNQYAKRKDEGDQAKRAKTQQGYTKNLTSYRIALDQGITYEMRTQNKYQDVIRRLTNLAQQAVNRMELDLQQRITFASATSYVDMDGATVDTTVGDTLALASTVHTVKGSSTTFRNILANNPQFSRGSIEGMELLVVEQTVNQFGEKMVVPFDILWSTDDPVTCNTIAEYLRSTASPDSANSGVVNVYKGKYRHVVLPLVPTDANGFVDTTKRKYWGLASSLYTTAHLDVWEEPHLKAPAAGNNGEDFSTDNWSYGVRSGYGIAIVNAAWFRISYGDGTA